MKLLFSVCSFLIITCNGFANNAENELIQSKIIEVFEVDCTDGYHHYHRYPYNCQKYYSCENGTLDVKDCPSDMNWNDDIKSCDLKDNIDCSRTITTDEETTSTTAATTTTATAATTTTATAATTTTPTTTTTNAATTTTATTTEGPHTTQKVECTGEHQYFPYPYDCSKYYECSNNKAYLLNCPEDEYWDNEAKMCDWSWNVDCVASSPPPTIETSTPSTHTTILPSTTPKIECTGEHQYFPYPYDCSKYYECSNNKAYLLNCPENEYWDDEAKMCDWSWNVDCVASTPPSYAGYTETMNK